MPYVEKQEHGIEGKLSCVQELLRAIFKCGASL
jgi:hypothetical protein